MSPAPRGQAAAQCASLAPCRDDQAPPAVAPRRAELRQARPLPPRPAAASRRRRASPGEALSLFLRSFWGDLEPRRCERAQAPNEGSVRVTASGRRLPGAPGIQGKDGVAAPGRRQDPLHPHQAGAPDDGASNPSGSGTADPKRRTTCEKTVPSCCAGFVTFWRLDFGHGSPFLRDSQSVSCCLQ